MKHNITSTTIWKSDYKVFTKLYNRVKLFTALGDIQITQTAKNFIVVTGQQFIIEELY